MDFYIATLAYLAAIGVCLMDVNVDYEDCTKPDILLLYSQFIVSSVLKLDSVTNFHFYFLFSVSITCFLICSL